MRITNIVLQGYRGFRLRQIDSFTFTPTCKTQVILGTNGSGKSSLLKELSPLPAVSQDFTCPGQKVIEIDHDNKHYVLSSLFTEQGNRYLFEVDGVNLNPGETISVYKDLCKEHFNYTQDIHNLLTGKIRFRNMSVADRRKWFMKISDTDYTYALRYYNELKEKTRDIQGSVKLMHTKLAQETEKLLSPAEEQALRIQIDEYNKYLNELLEHRKPRLINSQGYHDSLVTINNQLFDALDKLEALQSQKKEGETIESLEQQSLQTQIFMRGLEREISVKNEHTCQLQRDLDAINSAAYGSLEEVVQKLQKATEAIETLETSLTLGMRFEDPVTALQAFENIRPILEEQLNVLIDLPPVESSSEHRDETVARIEAIRRTIPEYQKQERELRVQIAHMEEHQKKEDTVCPSCHHSWKVGFDASRLASLRSDLEKVLTALNNAEKGLEVLQNALTLIDTKRNCFTTLERMKYSFSALKALWRFIAEGDYFHKDPFKLRSLLPAIHEEIRLQLTLSQRLKEKEELERVKRQMESTQQVDKTKLEEAIQKSNSQVLALQNEHMTLGTKLGNIKASIQVLRVIDECRETALTALQSREDVTKALISDKQTQVLDELINSVRLQLSRAQSTISRIDIQAATVKNLQEEVKLQEERLALAKMALQALSPTEGLIAKGMTNFINRFVEEINTFIGRIWLYPLELVPVELSEEEGVELNYRFNVRVNNDTRLVPDVSQTSAGMQEIIDLAFVATSMRYLGLTHYPIFLDEFAIALDNAHRESAYKAVSHIVNNTNYSQVFLVSHYQDTYVDLSDAEITVLCDSNISLPKHLNYNHHVKIN